MFLAERLRLGKLTKPQHCVIASLSDCVIALGQWTLTIALINGNNQWSMTMTQ